MTSTPLVVAPAHPAPAGHDGGGHGHDLYDQEGLSQDGHNWQRADADGPGEAARVRLASGVTTSTEVLLRLALDPSIMVRTALALNPATPAAAITALARDADTRVRTVLARRLAALAPSLTETEQSRLHQQALAALRHLVEDTAAQVRAAIADVVQAMADAPRALILCLARDTDIDVSEKVIRLSPLLMPADLLSLLAAPSVPAVALAVARRPDLTTEVSDAIAETADSVAIRALLLNHYAQIRETTLDALIARAADEATWHEPLVRRPSLSPGAAAALSRIVADDLLAELAGRADLALPVVTELRTRLAARLGQSKAQQADAARAWSGPTPSGGPSWTDVLAEARGRAAAGQLTEADLLVVAARGEVRLAAAMLSVAANVPLAVVERAATLRSPKGVVGLVWLAGFSMKLALPLQTLLARLSPSAVLAAGPGGTFPLAIEEMRWQIEFLSRGVVSAVANPPTAPPPRPAPTVSAE